MPGAGPVAAASAKTSSTPNAPYAIFFIYYSVCARSARQRRSEELARELTDAAWRVARDLLDEGRRDVEQKTGYKLKLT